MSSRRSIHRSRILGYAFYRDQTERPLFYQYQVGKFLNNNLDAEQAPLNPSILLKHLRNFEDDGQLKKIPDNGQATINEHPYLPPISPQRLERKYYQITEVGKDTFVTDLLSQISTGGEHRQMRRNIRELLYPEKLALFIARNPLIQQAIWENITGFNIDEIAPFNTIAPHDKSKVSIFSAPFGEQNTCGESVRNGEDTIEQLLRESNITL